MIGTLRVLRAETVRLVQLWSTWAVLLVLASVAAVRALLTVVTMAAERGGGEGPVSSGDAWAPLVDGWRAGLVLGAFVLLAQAARSLAGDREAGVLRLAVTRSAARGALVWGRLLLSPLLVVAVVAVTGLAAWAVASAGADFGPLVEDGYEIFTAEELRHEVLRGVVAVLPAFVATFAFGLLVSSVARSATVAVTTGLGLFLAFDLFKEVLGEGRYWIFAAHAPTLADSSAWSELPGVARGFSDAGFPEPLMRVGLLAPWPAVLLCALGAIFVLSRRPL